MRDEHTFGFLHRNTQTLHFVSNMSTRSLTHDNTLYEYEEQVQLFTKESILGTINHDQKELIMERRIGTTI